MTSHREANDDNCIFDNCILGSEGRCPSEQQVCVVQHESGHLVLTPQENVQQERHNLCLTVILSRFLSSPVPWCL